MGADDSLIKGEEERKVEQHQHLDSVVGLEPCTPRWGLVNQPRPGTWAIPSSVESAPEVFLL